MDDTLENAVLGDRYRLDRRMESGGMGTVWTATDLESGDRVAVKVINEELARDKSLRERFRREAMATAALANPHIVRTLDFGREEDGRAYIVMEYIEGETLSDAMKREAPIAQRRVVFIAAQVLDALAATHAAGIVHRDLKPPNILLTERAGVKDAVKLMDFGIAKLMESEAYQRLTRTGQIVGTPSFMAPEQARGDEIDGRADLYALGVVMYSALANRLPYDFANGAELLVAIQDQAPVPLPDTSAAVQRELWEEVIAPALAKNPDHRFASAHEMQTALKPFLRARTDDMAEIHIAEVRAAQAQPRPLVPAPADLARAKPAVGRSSSPKAQRPSTLAMGAVLALVLLVGMAIGSILTLKLAMPVRDGRSADPEMAAGTEPPPSETRSTADPEPAPSPPVGDDETVDAGRAEQASRRGAMSGGQMRRRGGRAGAPPTESDTCEAQVMLAATTSTGYTRDVARAVARPHVPRAALCLRGAHPRQIMITLDVDAQGRIGSATIGGPHTETESRCLSSIFSHTRLRAQPDVPGPLVLTLAAAGCRTAPAP